MCSIAAGTASSSQMPGQVQSTWRGTKVLGIEYTAISVSSALGTQSRDPLVRRGTQFLHADRLQMIAEMEAER